jgi:hypothetical protein
MIELNFLSHYYLQLTFNYLFKYFVFVKPILENKKIWFSYSYFVDKDNQKGLIGTTRNRLQ